MGAMMRVVLGRGRGSQRLKRGVMRKQINGEKADREDDDEELPRAAPSARSPAVGADAPEGRDRHHYETCPSEAADHHGLISTPPGIFGKMAVIPPHRMHRGHDETHAASTHRILLQVARCSSTKTRKSSRPGPCRFVRRGSCLRDDGRSGDSYAPERAGGWVPFLLFSRLQDQVRC